MRTLRRFTESAERLSLSSHDTNLLYCSLPDDVASQIAAEERVRRNDIRFAEGVGPFVSARKKPRGRMVNPATDPRQRIDDGWRCGNDVLNSIPAETYLEVLADAEPSRGRCHCPLPDHEDRNPSASYVDNVWFCHRCGVGGSIFTLGAALTGLRSRGADFLILRKWLAQQMVGAVA